MVDGERIFVESVGVVMFVVGFFGVCVGGGDYCDFVGGNLV